MRSLIGIACLLVGCAPVASDAPPGVARGLPDYLWCDAAGQSPIADGLVGAPLSAFDAYPRAEGVVYDIAEIGPDGIANLLLIETDDLITVLHRDRVIESISCIRRDVCSAERRVFSNLCAG